MINAQLQNKNHKIPKLRFPEFSGEWEKKKLSSFLIEKNETAPKNNQYPLMAFVAYKGVAPKGERYNREFLVNDVTNKKYKKTEYGDFIYSSNNLETGSIGLNHYGPASISPVYSIFKISESCDYRFINEYFARKDFINRMIRYRQGAVYGQWKIHESDFLRIEENIPSIQEQEKIANFLVLVDELINTLKHKKDILIEYKKGMIQKIFSQEIRFKDDFGKSFSQWEKKKLEDYLCEHKTRNIDNKYQEVFSVAKEKGVINQIEHLGRSYSAESLLNYKVIFPGDIVYTKSPTSDFPFGIIKQNKTNRIGVVSTLYAVFRPNNRYIGTLIHEYFLSWVNTYNYLNPLVQKGAKNTINIVNDNFLNGRKLFLPSSKEEQKKIVDFLETFDELIEVKQQQITLAENWKKGLMQGLFI